MKKLILILIAILITAFVIVKLANHKKPFIPLEEVKEIPMLNHINTDEGKG